MVNPYRIVSIFVGAALMVAIPAVSAEAKLVAGTSAATTVSLSDADTSPFDEAMNGDEVGATMSMCSAAESAARNRCMSSCSQNETAIYTPGVCGVGGGCKCMVNDQEPPIGLAEG